MALDDFADWTFISEHSGALELSGNVAGNDGSTDDSFRSLVDTRRTRSGGLAVPPVHQHVPQSLQSSLKRGGKPIPEVKRPRPAFSAPCPRKSQQAPSDSTRVQIASMQSNATQHPPRGPKLASISAPSKREGLSSDLQKRWIIFVNMIGNLSSFWQMYSESKSFEQHCVTLLAKYEVSTVSKYIATLQSFHTVLQDFKLSWNDIGTHRIADLLQISREGRSTDYGFGASSVVKALRWAQRLLEIEHWDNLHSPLVSAFTIRPDGDRTEAVPLSLFVVLSWEKRILLRECPLQELILLGGLLVLLWGGLRFSDGQRVPLHSLSWAITALRGTCRKTKTTKSGQPWAVQASGFLSYGSFGWLAKWLMALDGLWATHATPGDKPDFLLPMTSGSGFVTPLIPMSYSQALKWLRYFCTIPWRNSLSLPISAPHNYTVHSLKSTTLSWSAQLAQRPYHRGTATPSRSPSSRKHETL